MFFGKGVGILPGRNLGGLDAYQAKVVSYTPIAYWPLEETVGSTAVCLIDSNQNGTYNGVTLNSTTSPTGQPAPYFDGGLSSYVDVYTATLGGVFNGSEGSLIAWCQVYDSGVWAGGHVRPTFGLDADVNNYIGFGIAGAANTLEYRYRAGGTFELGNKTTSTTSWMHLGMSWSASGDEVAYYFDGASAATSSTSLGTWSGSLSNAKIGFGLWSGESWYGYISHVALFDSVLDGSAMSDLATV